MSHTTMSHEAVAENSKALAKDYADKGIFGRAFSHYLVALNLRPEWKDQLKEKFTTVLCKWGNILDEKNRFDDLFKCYEQAVEIFPDDTIILNNLGSHLLRCGLLKEAAHYFKKCLNINPHFIRAARNLENVSNLAVERWHFRMLNDQHRNEAFREAIIKKTRQGFDRVLDIGTGTGILSLFASEGNAREVYACDSSTTMIEIAEGVFHSNNVSNIKLINKHSSELQIPGDIHEKVSLLVTETFDAGLFGEGILQTLTHAWEHLLLPPHPQFSGLNPNKFGLVIPFGATVYATGIELDVVANDFHIKRTSNLFLFENCNIVRMSDYYDTQDLSRTAFKCLTETVNIFDINFNDPNALTEALRGWRKELIFKYKSSGRLDCFAVWFDLSLDEDIKLSTNPLSEANIAWDHAIFLLPRSVTIGENQNIPAIVALENSKLNIILKDSFNDESKFEVSENTIKILNDNNLTTELHQVSKKLGPTFENSLEVLDCYCFPVFGLNFLISRSDKFMDKLTCFVQTESEKRLISFLSQKFHIKVNVFLKAEAGLEAYLQDKKFDVVLLDPVEMTGEAKDEFLMQLNFLKSLVKPGGLILPDCVEVIGQFIYSDWLCTAARVQNNSVTCGYNIAEHINLYQVQHFIDLPLNAIDKVTSCEPFQLFSLLDSHDTISEMTVPCLPSACFANAMVYWFKIGFIKGCKGILTCEDTCYHQVAVLVPKIELSERIKFNLIRENGLFSIKMLKS